MDGRPNSPRSGSSRSASRAGAALAGLLAAAALAAPASAQVGAGSCPDAELQPAPGNAGQVEAAVLCLVNAERGAAGAAPLQRNASLDWSALSHSLDMVAGSYFAHEQLGRPSLRQRIVRSGYMRDWGYSVFAENIGAGPLGNSSAAALVRAWLATSEHSANILSRSLGEIGIAIAFSGPHPAFFAEHSSAVFTTDFGHRYRKLTPSRRKRCNSGRASQPSVSGDDRASAKTPRRHCTRVKKKRRAAS